MPAFVQGPGAVPDLLESAVCRSRSELTTMYVRGGTALAFYRDCMDGWSEEDTLPG